MAQTDGSVVVGVDVKLNAKEADRELGRLKRKILDLENTLYVNQVKKSAIEQSLSSLGGELDKEKAKLSEMEKDYYSFFSKNDISENDISAQEKKIMDLQERFDEVAKEVENYDRILKDTNLTLDAQKGRYGDIAMEAERLAAQEREAAEEERLEAERIAEEKARLAEEERLEAERIAEEKARHEAEKLEAAERLAELVREGPGAVDLQVGDTVEELNQTDDALDRVGDKTKRVGGLFRKLFGTVASKAVSGTKKAVAALSQKLLGLFKSSRKANTGFSQGLKTILRYGLGIETLFALVNKLRGVLTDGFKNLAQFSTETNDSISMVQSSLTQLKNAAATAFAPLLTVAAPVLTQFIQLMSSAADQAARLTATLTGKSSYTRAKKVQEDYAASLEGTGEAAEDASLALAGFDEINLLSTKDTEAAGGGKATPAEMFEEVEIEPVTFDSWGDALSQLLDKAQSAIPQFESIFSTIAEKINDFTGKVYEALTFPGINEKAGGLGSSITGLFDTLFTDVNWEQMGQTVGAGFNTALNFLNGVVTGFDWVGLGRSLSEGINGFFGQVDWNLLGQTLSNSIRGILGTVIEFVQTLDWKEIGTSIAEILNGYDWSGILTDAGTAISSSIKGIVDFLWEFITKTDWNAMGRALGDGINALFDIDWYKLGETIISAIVAALKFLSSALETVDWRKIGDDIAKLLQGAIEAIDWDEIGRFVSDLLIGALELVTGLLTGVNWGNLARSILNGIATALAEIDWLELVGVLIDGLSSVFGAVIDLNLGISSGLYDAIGTLLDAVGLEKVGGLFHDIADAISLVTDVISGFVDAVIDTVDGIINWFKEGGTTDELSEIITGFMDDMKEVFGEAWENIKGIFSSAWENIKAIWSTGANWYSENFVQPIIVALASMVAKNTAFFRDLFTKIKEIWSGAGKWFQDKVTTPIKNAFQSMGNAVKSILNGVIGNVEKLINSAIKGVNWMIGQLNKVSFSVPDWISDLVPSLGGKSFGINIPYISETRLPRLAQGAVIPPNREFMAVLGDQKSGTNLEAPEALIRKIVREESGGTTELLQAILEAIRSGHVIMVDGAVFGQTAIRTINTENTKAGRQLLRI